MRKKLLGMLSVLLVVLAVQVVFNTPREPAALQAAALDGQTMLFPAFSSEQAPGSLTSIRQYNQGMAGVQPRPQAQVTGTPTAVPEGGTAEQVATTAAQLAQIAEQFAQLAERLAQEEVEAPAAEEGVPAEIEDEFILDEAPPVEEGFFVEEDLEVEEDATLEEEVDAGEGFFLEAEPTLPDEGALEPTPLLENGTVAGVREAARALAEAASGLSESAERFAQALDQLTTAMAPAELDVEEAAVVAPVDTEPAFPDEPEVLVGETVTLRGEVSEAMNRRAFRLAVDGTEIGVLSPRELIRPLEEGERLRVMGAVREFERDEIEEELGVELQDEVAQELAGEPVILASSIQTLVRAAEAEGTPTPEAEETPEATPTPAEEEAEVTPTPTERAARTPTPAATPTPAEGAQAEQQPPIQVVADNIAFVIPEDNMVTVAAGSHVVIEFTNREAVPHNWAAYRSSDAQEAIFVGEIITGPDATRTYEFDAPTEPGNYYYQCDVHPQTMTGDFIVEASGG